MLIPQTPRFSSWRMILAMLAVQLCMSSTVRADQPLPATIQFNRDIRPILSDNCFFCHGPDKNKRKADLRLDTREGLFASVAGKRPAIVSGKPQDSELYKRLITEDDDDRMPDPKSGKHLSPREIALIQRWIEQGASYQGHWSYQKLVRPQVPLESRSEKREAGSEKAGGMEARRHAGTKKEKTIGNPIDAFLLDRLSQSGLSFSAEASREQLVRRLYFDLLGLPPTTQQVDAFVHDSSPRAYQNLVEALLHTPHFGERMAVYWLDLVRYADSIGYHSDNPRDISPYRDWVIAAFNANMPFDQFTREQLAGDLLPGATTSQKIASAYNRLLQTTEEGGAQPKEYAAKYLADRVRNLSAVWLAGTMTCAECHDHKFDPYTMRDFYSLAAFFADLKEPAVGKRGEGMLLGTPQQLEQVRKLEVAIGAAKKPLETSTPRLEAAQKAWEASIDLKRPPKGRDGKPIPKDVLAVLAIAPEQRSDAQKNALAAYYRTIAPLLDEPRKELAKAEKARADYVKPIRKVLVSESQPPVTVKILPRGNWNTDSGEIVTPAVPHFLPQISANGAGVETSAGHPPTRLDLANWLTSPDNPLTARVFINRLWKLFFGAGLSKTLEDLGSQGEWPTHPELLDWLAAEFQASGWDIGHMIRLIVTSRAYRQISYASSALRETDPFNRLIARQGRWRLDAEFLRDNALSISGLLELSIGGESVRPYQPEGYWDFLNFPKRTYFADSGSAQYHRGLYVWWQRTFLQPSLVNFDAPSREEAACERNRSNTPQQALTLLNDPTYVEAARVFAQRMIAQGGSAGEARLAWAFRCATGRNAKPEEISLLRTLLDKHFREYTADPAAARAFLGSAGQSAAPPEIDPTALAAYTSVARAILNLHETITRN